MKKNFAMRIAACLLVVTMLSLCMVSYTYAKYVTTDEASASAQVAKWGVQVHAELADMFAKGYDASNAAVDDDSTATVWASGEYNLLAPGTEDQTAAALTISGTPEVAVSVAYVAEVTLAKWEIAGNEYCPLVITVNVDGTPTNYSIDGSAIKTVAELEAAVEEAITSLAAEYGPNKDLAKSIIVSWSWAFDGDDAKDTALGDQAATTGAASFSIKVGATVTQLN